MDKTQHIRDLLLEAVITQAPKEVTDWLTARADLPADWTKSREAGDESQPAVEKAEYAPGLTISLEETEHQVLDALGGPGAQVKSIGHAVRLYRQLQGCGLREAHSGVERIVERYNIGYTKHTW